MAAKNKPLGKVVVLNPHGVEIVEWPFIFSVPSRSFKGARRRVDWESKTCDCPAGRHKTPCRHREIVGRLFDGIWRKVAERMTHTEAGWQILREIESAIDLDSMR